jgi:uncharacterized protein (TIGR02588 family)
VTLAASVLVVTAMVVVALVEEARRVENASGNLEITFDEERTEFLDGTYRIPYTVRNTGSEAIAEAEIWFDAYDGDRVVESIEISVQFLPLQGVQEGVYVTALDPATHPVVGRLESLQFP